MIHFGNLYNLLCRNFPTEPCSFQFSMRQVKSWRSINCTWNIFNVLEIWRGPTFWSYMLHVPYTNYGRRHVSPKRRITFQEQHCDEERTLQQYRRIRELYQLKLLLSKFYEMLWRREEWQYRRLRELYQLVPLFSKFYEMLSKRE